MNTIKNKEPMGIPWQGAHDWDQVSESIKRIDFLYDANLKPVREMAQKIQHHFEQISGLIEELCSYTCSDCQDICCIRATIWFDFKDLLYMYFGRKTFPENQIFKKQADSQKACCHFSEKGCVLSRLERPFVCTWYFCPVQTTYLSVHDTQVKDIIEDHLNEIKALRKKMETVFVAVSSGR